MSPVLQGAPTVSVPYLIRPKLIGNTVSTDCGSWDGNLVRTRESDVLSRPGLPNLVGGSCKLLGLTLSVCFEHMRQTLSL